VAGEVRERVAGLGVRVDADALLVTGERPGVDVDQEARPAVRRAVLAEGLEGREVLHGVLRGVPGVAVGPELADDGSGRDEAEHLAPVAGEVADGRHGVAQRGLQVVEQRTDLGQDAARAWQHRRRGPADLGERPHEAGGGAGDGS
jgi:hypothetical protein